MQVKESMRTHVPSVPPDALVSTAYQMMTLHGSRFRHLPVVTWQHVLVGILTDRDVRLAAASDVPSMAEHEFAVCAGKAPRARHYDPGSGDRARHHRPGGSWAALPASQSLDASQWSATATGSQASSP